MRNRRAWNMQYTLTAVALTQRALERTHGLGHIDGGTRRQDRCGGLQNDGYDTRGVKHLCVVREVRVNGLSPGHSRPKHPLDGASLAVRERGGGACRHLVV